MELSRAREVAQDLMKDPEHALDTLAREELGLNPDDLGSPWGASASSFAASSTTERFGPGVAEEQACPAQGHRWARRALRGFVESLAV